MEAEEEAVEEVAAEAVEEVGEAEEESEFLPGGFIRSRCSGGKFQVADKNKEYSFSCFCRSLVPALGRANAVITEVISGGSCEAAVRFDCARDQPWFL